jgi:hypothetical protein
LKLRTSGRPPGGYRREGLKADLEKAGIPPKLPEIWAM